MRISVRWLLTSAACLLFVSPAQARKPAQPAVTVAGVYENFTVGKSSGDLEGTRVVIVPAGGGYYAIVQIAQGGAEDPNRSLCPLRLRGERYLSRSATRSIRAPLPPPR